ncbi:MAG TPA: SulP family inorganic anion transporter, partial [Burkholderiaceae bacterium]|nr:SulP family inorganic anion transporter [Burkholderiaceae bacterium]
MRRWLPGWAFGYQRRWLGADLLAGLVVATLLIPQSLAYAMLAGLPPHLGLYASIVPLLAYAAFGSSMTLSVGPVAVISLMTAAALAPLAAAGSPEYVALAATLALLTGAMLAAAGLLRLGFVADLLSHSVVSGFISGSAVLIIVGQLRPLVGISAAGDTAVELLLALIASFPDAKPATALLGIAALLLLWLARRHMAPALRRLGLAESAADLLARLAPMAIVIGAAAGVAALALDARYAIAVVGPIPQGLP